MLCKRCNAVMKSGTSYKKKENNEKGYKRYEECPKCHEKIYNNSPNFQEVLIRVSGKRRNK